MHHVSAQGIDERMINVHYYYYDVISEHNALRILSLSTFSFSCSPQAPANHFPFGW